MFLLYFGLGVFGISGSALVAAGLGADGLFRLLSRRNLARRGEGSIAKTRFEAAECLGLTRWQALHATSHRRRPKGRHAADGRVSRPARQNTSLASVAS